MFKRQFKLSFKGFHSYDSTAPDNTRVDLDDVISKNPQIRERVANF